MVMSTLSRPQVCTAPGMNTTLRYPSMKRPNNLKVEKKKTMSNLRLTWVLQKLMVRL